MATNDGYSPYPIGLTAAQTVEAINRAYNLDDEINNASGFTSGPTQPAIESSKTGDLWFNTNLFRLFRAYVEDTTLLWFEV